MVIIWYKQAIQDLKMYKQNSKMLTDEKINNYMISLVNYIDILSTSPYLGKLFCAINEIEIRQLMLKMHRIFYYISNNKIYILAIIHTSYDIDNVINHLSKAIDYI